MNKKLRNCFNVILPELENIIRDTISHGKDMTKLTFRRVELLTELKIFLS